MEVNSTTGVEAVQRISSEAPDTEEYSKEDQVLEAEEVHMDMADDGIGQRIDILA